MIICYLGIGSNIGDRRRNIKQAIKKINLFKNTRVLKISKLFVTEPLGCPPGVGKFLNGAIKISTKITPQKLLSQLKKIEKELGRVKNVVNGPRCIDLDILLYGDTVMKAKNLVIPHPRMFEREFVLKPLSQII